jgi:hypothetical protein
MTARVVALGAGAEAGGSGSLTHTILTVPAGVVETDVALVVVAWNATALEAPPTSVMFGGTGWTTLVAPRTDGTMGFAVYAGRGFSAGDLIVHQLGSTRQLHMLDIYVRDAAAPSSWVVGAVTTRSVSSAVTTAAGMALADLATTQAELNLAISVERTNATPTVVLSSPGADTVLYREAVNLTNLTSIWFGKLPGTSSPSSAITITMDDASANGTALQLAIPAAVVTATPGLLRPNTELVAVSWLKGLTYLGTRVATELPRDNATWSASGFVTVTAAGGPAPLHIPWREGVVDVSTWGVTPTSGRPPWNLAAQLAEAIVTGTLDHKNVPRRVTMPSAAYAPAFVKGARVMSEPRRVPGDAADYARFTMDLALDWVEVPA